MESFTPFASRQDHIIGSPIPSPLREPAHTRESRRGTVETSASFEARSAPSSYPTSKQSRMFAILRENRQNPAFDRTISRFSAEITKTLDWLAERAEFELSGDQTRKASLIVCTSRRSRFLFRVDARAKCEAVIGGPTRARPGRQLSCCPGLIV
jgi:hypothetical protein